MSQQLKSQMVFWEGDNGFAEASDLGFPVGIWPGEFWTEVNGEERRFDRRNFSPVAGYAQYSSGALTVRVFND